LICAEIGRRPISALARATTNKGQAQQLRLALVLCQLSLYHQ
jgi:hypothetical protein